MRRLVAGEHREVLTSFVPLRHDATGFDWQMRLAMGAELGFDDVSGFAEALGRIAAGKHLMRDQITR